MYFASLLFVLFPCPLWLFQVECASKLSDLPERSEIVQINVVYRHGDRSPVVEYPTSKYINSSFWPNGWGQLSLKGMQQQFKFGRWLMKEYGPTGKNLIPSTYNAKDYLVFSTDVDRTIMSGLANTAGVYYPMPGRGIENNIQWQPIPIRAIPADEDDEIFGQFCPVVEETLNQLRPGKFMEMKARNPELFQYVEDMSGVPTVNYPELILMVDDALLCENVTFDEIPKWAEKIFPYPLKNYRMEFFKLYSSTEKLKRLTAGPLIKRVIENMSNKTQGMDKAKVYSYSAHDANVFSILNAIGLPPEESPAYTSAVIFELYKSPENIYYVQLLYRPGSEMEAKPLTVPKCDGRQFCPLKDLIEITAHLLPDSLKKECQAETSKSTLSRNRQAFVANRLKPFQH